MRIADKNGVTEHGITEEEIDHIYNDYFSNLEQDRSMFFTYADIFKYPSLRVDYAKVGAVFFILMFLQYGPALLLQRLMPNIYLSGLLNGVAQFGSIPFMGYLNKNTSRRKGLMGMFAFASIFTLFQYFLNH
jgi:hypothetical protein